MAKFPMHLSHLLAHKSGEDDSHQAGYREIQAKSINSNPEHVVLASEFSFSASLRLNALKWFLGEFFCAIVFQILDTAQSWPQAPSFEVIDCGPWRMIGI